MHVHLWKTLITAGAAGLLLLAAAACKTVAGGKAAQTSASKNDEYVEVTETGSRVRRLVKKSELSQLQSPDLHRMSGEGWSTAGGDGGSGASAAGKGR